MAKCEKKLNGLAPMVKNMERLAVEFSADPDKTLPESGTPETAKSYREKKAKPLVKKIVSVLYSVYHAYIDISREFEDVQKSCNQAWGKVNALSARVEELWEENGVLRDKVN